MKRMGSVVAVLGPLLVLGGLLAAVLVSQRGITPHARAIELEQLAPLQEETVQPGSVQEQTEDGFVDLLILTGAEKDFQQTLTDVVEDMRLSYRSVDIEAFSLPMLESADTVLICTQDLSALDGETMVALIGWVEDGGHLGFTLVPNTDSSFQVISRKLGISDYEAGYVKYHAFRFKDGFLPVFNDLVFDVELEDFALAVRLEEDCQVYMETADGTGVPLLWSRELESGRIAVFNTSLMQGKDGRGFALDVLSVLCDTLCYPIINAGMVFVDDFPAPQPEGFDERLKEQFGYDVQGFFRNHWWPDMKELTWKYGVRYTGVLVETYNDIVEPPFEPDGVDHALIRFYTSEILQSGGEVGLHGYNHQPLCPDGFEYAGEDYHTWPSTENMRLAVAELLRYGKSFLPSASFTTYVPPSNYLSEEGQQVVLRTVPTVTTISGLYLPEEGINALVQEFEEEEDGSISVPRITSGFAMDGYNELVAAHELMLHGVFSHFIHPDDVLDDDRGADLGWMNMYQSFTDALDRVEQAYPELRWCTATEGGAAVQRYDRVNVRRTRVDERTLEFTLSPFYDEVWLALRCKQPPESVENGELYPMSEGLYWIRATGENVRITWGTAL